MNNWNANWDGMRAGFEGRAGAFQLFILLFLSSRWVPFLFPFSFPLLSSR
jgi:hypothetical protein